MNGEYKIGDVVLGNWTLNRLIGEGSYGKVYEATREDFGVTYTAAIKIITIPQNKSEIKSVMSEGMDEKSVTQYFRTMVEEIVREFSLMSRLEGTANVVGYKDHIVLPHENEVGWDIIIRMELLTPLLDYLGQREFNQQDVIKLGIDLCRALELCQRFNIVHRDIKPENIFVSELGDYKLGDFGIARTVEKTTDGLSKKGTYTYMAPEVYKENAYGSSVDIYSLGLVLYRLLNDNRAPFLPQYPAPITYSDRETALAKRISGEQLPAPHHADGQLAEIVLKACAYDPKDRYSDPLDMKKELEYVLYAGEEKNTSLAAENCEKKTAEQIEKPDIEEQVEKTESIFSGRNPIQEIEDATASVFSLRNDHSQKPNGENGREWQFFDNSNLNVEYEYTQTGDILRKTQYDAKGQTKHWWGYEYDAMGRPIKETCYNADKTLRFWCESGYDWKGNRTRWALYSADGSAKYHYGFEYDAYGNMIKRIVYGADGSISHEERLERRK